MLQNDAIPSLSGEARLEDFIQKELWHLASKLWLGVVNGHVLVQLVGMEEDVQNTLFDPRVT